MNSYPDSANSTTMALPIRLARAWLDRVSFPVIKAALLVFAPLALIFIGGSRWLLRDGVRVWNSELEFTGFVLVIVVVSTYLVAAIVEIMLDAAMVN